MIFSVCVSVHTPAVPHLPTGGYPHQVLTGGNASRWGDTPILPDGQYTGGTPHQDWMGYATLELDGASPCQDWMGVPPPQSRLNRGIPLPHREIGRQSSYAVGGMPLSLTQEDFLVFTKRNANMFSTTIY